jgi:hypothetical protein
MYLLDTRMTFSLMTFLEMRKEKESAFFRTYLISQIIYGPRTSPVAACREGVDNQSKKSNSRLGFTIDG